jgi:glycosyltransferase involved in cell wall biosynthesis
MATAARIIATSMEKAFAADSPHEDARVAILMPVHNGVAALRATLESLRSRAEAMTVFLVDDGSEPAIAPSDLPEPTDAFRIVLARHVVNLGQGAALETARQLALKGATHFSAYVTMDADGQHRAADAMNLARAIEEGADVAFGNRFLGDSNVPPARRAVLLLARWFERAITGLRLADAHNGLRAFGRSALERVRIRQNRMAHATEIKLLVSRAELRIVEVPVSVRYTKETLARGQTNAGAALILRDLMLQYLFGDSK